MAKLKVQLQEQLYSASDRSYLKRDYNTNEPTVDKDGLNTYRCEVMTTTNGHIETFEVNIKGKEDPLAKIPPMTPVTLVNPEISFGVYNGKKYWTLNATAIKKA